MPGRQKSLIGTVVSDKMEKTVTVLVQSSTRHRLYHKIVRRSKRFLAHDDLLGAKEGDIVRILEARPLSRRKRWRVAEIIQRREVAEIAPREIDAEYLGRPREREAEPAVEEAVAAEAPSAETPEEAPPEAPAPEPEASVETPTAEVPPEAVPDAQAEDVAAAPAGEELVAEDQIAPALEGTIEEEEEGTGDEPADAEEPAAEETSEENLQQEREET